MPTELIVITTGIVLVTVVQHLIALHTAMHSMRKTDMEDIQLFSWCVTGGYVGKQR